MPQEGEIRIYNKREQDIGNIKGMENKDKGWSFREQDFKEYSNPTVSHPIYVMKEDLRRLEKERGFQAKVQMKHAEFDLSPSTLPRRQEKGGHQRRKCRRGREARGVMEIEFSRTLSFEASKGTNGLETKDSAMFKSTSDCWGVEMRVSEKGFSNRVEEGDESMETDLKGEDGVTFFDSFDRGEG
ncbi:hypothetical protein HAX54_028835 [Datura stramonium]|uniref:Uncharacterized protein n=1 Tax=Datura stramonium TaxID=4076 RepID=A0ABS8S9U1_DATST|nr:hypothetical protein [Datura stramonium]